MLKLQYFGHLMRRVDSLEKTLMLGGIGGRRSGFMGAGPNRNLPLRWQCPSLSDRYRLLPVDSTCPLDPLLSPWGSLWDRVPIPFTTSESPLDSSASLPGFCRRRQAPRGQFVPNSSLQPWQGPSWSPTSVHSMHERISE